MNRLLGYERVGQVTFTPDDLVTDVGGFSIDPDHDTIWVRVVSEQPPTPWPWSYGILGWKTENGYELGSVKAYSDQSGQVFKLSVGLVPTTTTGVLTFAPRGYNLAWVKKGNPWTLTFEAQSGISGSVPDVPVLALGPLLGCLLTLLTLASLTPSKTGLPAYHYPLEKEEGEGYGRRSTDSN